MLVYKISSGELASGISHWFIFSAIIVPLNIPFSPIFPKRLLGISRGKPKRVLAKWKIEKNSLRKYDDFAVASWTDAYRRLRLWTQAEAKGINHDVFIINQIEFSSNSLTPPPPAGIPVGIAGFWVSVGCWCVCLARIFYLWFFSSWLANLFCLYLTALPPRHRLLIFDFPHPLDQSLFPITSDPAPHIISILSWGL